MAALMPTTNADVINIGAERRKRSQRNAQPVQSVEMALLLSMMASLSPKTARRMQEELARWHAARPDDVAVQTALKAAEAIWGAH